MDVGRRDAVANDVFEDVVRVAVGLFAWLVDEDRGRCDWMMTEGWRDDVRDEDGGQRDGARDADRAIIRDHKVHQESVRSELDVIDIVGRLLSKFLFLLA